MSASPLTKPRLSSIRFVKRDLRPLAANASPQQGSLAIALLGATSPGFYKQAAAGDVGVVVGRFTQTVSNTGGADGAVSAEIDFFKDRWLFLLDNDTGTPVTTANREGACYALDDHTATEAAGAQGVVGVVYDVTSEGVWVETRAPLPQEQVTPNIQSGTSTLVAGTKTITGVVLTSTSRIMVTMKDPGAGSITSLAALDAPVASRNTGSGQFVVNAINDSAAVLTTAVCTFDYVIIG